MQHLLNAVEIAVSGCTVGLLVIVSGYRQSRTAARTAQIQEAASLLSKHYAGVEAFTEDPASPEILQDLLLSFSDAAADPNIAADLPRVAPDPAGALTGTAGLTRKFEEAAAHVRGLATYRPDLSTRFEAAVSDGVHALLLRWDETASLYDELVARMCATPDQQLRLAVYLAGAAGTMRTGSAVGEQVPAAA